MTTLYALILDAYRELNSRKLFWIVMVLSGLFVVVYASIGFDQNGMFIFYGAKHFESELLTHGSPMARLLYRGVFATFVVPIWLAWIATILALISTAPIFPEFIASGSVDLILCKPITRLRLFLSKYFASLLFVVLQVLVFCTGIFLAIGWRIGDWDWRVFLAVPIVTLFYSYLYSFCVLLGVWTRSTLAALLLTLLMWFGIYAISATEGIVTLVRTQFEIKLEDLDRPNSGEHRRAAAAAPDSQPATSTGRETERKKLQDGVDSLKGWLKLVQVVRWPLPKTSETIQLLGRQLSREGDINLMDLFQGKVMMGADGRPIKREPWDSDQRAQERMIREAEQDSAQFIIGTSLLFEALMLAGAAWIFCRRDF